MQKIKKCVIPAAGFGTRFLPATKAMPKEMLPIVDKPVMQYLVEEAVNAGCTDIIIITGKGKRAIEDHFDANFELEYTLEQNNKNEYLDIVRNVSKLANFAYIRQPYPKGDGDAILRAKDYIGDEPFLVLFGDDIIDNKVSAANQLIALHERKNTSVIACTRVGDDETKSYGIIESSNSEGRVHLVDKFLEKPDAKQTKSRTGVIGKYVLTGDIFEYLEKASKLKNNGEIRLADAFELMIKSKDVYGYEVEGTRYDTGSKIGFIKATVDFALKDKNLKGELMEHLKNIVK